MSIKECFATRKELKKKTSTVNAFKLCGMTEVV